MNDPAPVIGDASEHAERNRWLWSAFARSVRDNMVAEFVVQALRIGGMVVLARALSPNGLVANIVSFNVGVEIGQVIALTGVLLVLSYWRTRSGFLRYAFVTNGVLMAGGFLLVGYQLSGYFLRA